MRIPKVNGIAAVVQSMIVHKTVVYIVTAAVVILGIIGLKYMNKEEFPSFIIKQGLVVGVYPGATADEVEKQLADPLEQMLLSFPEVKRNNLRSISREGKCFIFADLNCRPSEKDEVWSRINIKLQNQKLMLPPGVLAILVKDDFNSITSILIALESDDKGYAELNDYAKDIERRLRRLPNLAKVNILGCQKEEVAVNIDREKLSQYGVSPTSLLLGYQTSSMPMPGGVFSFGSGDVPVHIYGNSSTEKEIYEKIVYTDPTGDVLRLKDIAKVERRYKKPESMVSFNGHSCLILSVEMRHGKNIVAFGKDVDKVLNDFMADAPESINISRISDLPKVVGDSVSSFLRDLGISMLVVIFVMLMLFPLKSALIAGSGVPICTMLTVAVMYVTGMELHTVTLAGLIVVLGMIVDNSIITMDGYMDKLSHGYSKMEAASLSMKEIFAPTLAATLAISAMFFPMNFILTGYLGEFVKLFPFIVAIALLISLLYAVAVVPSLEVRYINSAAGKNDSIFSKGQSFFFNLLDKGYKKAEGFCFRHPVVTIGGGIIAVVLGLLMFSTMNIQMMPKAARDFFAIEIELEAGNGVEDTRKVCNTFESILRVDPRVRSVTSFVGSGAPRFNSSYAPILPSNASAQMIVNTVSAAATEALIKECDNKYEHLFPQANVRFKQMDYQAVDAPIIVSLLGEDRNVVKPQADSISAFLHTLSEDVKWVHSTADDIQPAASVKLDGDEAGRLGVNKALVAINLAGSFEGLNIANIWEGDKEIEVNLYNENHGSGFDAIGNQMVATAIPGVNVPLRQIASITPEWSATTLERIGAEQSISVMADMKYGKSQPVAMKKLEKYIDENIKPTMPEGYKIEYNGLTATNREVIPEVILTLFCAITILFLFLVFHLKKFSLAFLTLILSSLCLFGAFLGLWIFKLDFGLTAILGVISLVGIIVRNGILMFEYAEQLRKEGNSVKEAAMLAGARRMRPIFLTSCTTALGVIPMVISGDLLWQPMGVVICFGTMLSIFLIVLVMPVSYWQIFKKGNA